MEGYNQHTVQTNYFFNKNISTVQGNSAPLPLVIAVVLYSLMTLTSEKCHAKQSSDILTAYSEDFMFIIMKSI